MYLLDTNHCSELIDKNPVIYQKLASLDATPVATCTIVRGELRYMVEKSSRKRENEVKVNAFLSGIEIFPVDDRAADLYGIIKERLFSMYGSKVTKPARKVRLKDIAFSDNEKDAGFSDNDLWIAAVAAEKGFTVVSSDRGFLRIKAAFTDLRYETWLPS